MGKITPKSQKIALGSNFAMTYFFDLWQLFSSYKSKMRKSVDHKNARYHPYSRAWIERELLSSKAFRIWLGARWISTFLSVKIAAPLISVSKKYISQRNRGRLKLFYWYFFPPRDKIKQSDLSDFSKWSMTRNNDCADVCIFGVLTYNYRIQRPQHLAQELAKKGHRVFYIENEFIYSNDKQNPAINIRKEKHNLYVVTLSSPVNYFIYQDVPGKLARQVILASFRRFLHIANIVNPIAKIDHPFWASIVDEIAMPVIYDCMDDHSGFKETGSNIEELENKLLEKSQLVLASSAGLAKSISRKNPPGELITLRNAGDHSFFSRSVTAQLPIPDDLRDIKGPIIGYFGAISEWFNAGMVAYAANKHPDWSFVLIGRLDNPEIEQAAKRFDNIHLLGEKPYTELPAYLQRFDVCLIPFLLTDLIKNTNPVKIYEYFAAGKPVVATKIPELNQYRELLYLASSEADFVKKIEAALTESNKSKLLAERQEVAKENTWVARAEVLDRHIREILFPRVSIVTLVHNNPTVTKRMIDSVLKRSQYPNFELIVVDNASDIATRKLLAKYQADKRVRLITNNQNLGFAKGNNVGLQKANVDYIIVVNNDVIVTPGWISRLIYHVGGEGIGLVGPVTNNIGNEAKINIFYNSKDGEAIESTAAEYTYRHWGQSMKLENIAAFCWIMKRGLYEEIGGFDERFGRGLFEDDDYCRRVLENNKTILVADDVFIHHEGGSTTDWQSKEYQDLLAENKAKFEAKWNTKWKPHKYRRGVK